MPALVQRFLPPSEPLSIECSDIQECLVGPVNWTNRIVIKPLLVRSKTQTLRFYLAGNPLMLMTSGRKQTEWRDLIAGCAEQALHQKPGG